MCEHLTALLARRTPFSQAKSGVLTANTTIKQKSTEWCFLAFMVEVRRFELRASWTRMPNRQFLPSFPLILTPFLSENHAFVTSCEHCFHLVRSRRWSKVWSSPFRWDEDAIRKSKIQLRNNSFSAVIIPYISVIVKRLLSTLKICIAEVKEKTLRKKLDLFSKKCWTSSLFCGMLLC